MTGPSELPTDFHQLLTRLVATHSEAFNVRFHQDLLRERVSRVADTYENGWALLRDAAVAQLADEDAEKVDRALAVLFVVGNAGDAAAVGPLDSHGNELIRKAARTCLFEIRRRPG